MQTFILDACPNKEEIVQISIIKGFVRLLWIKGLKYILKKVYPIRIKCTLDVYSIYFNKSLYKYVKESGNFFFLFRKNSNYKEHEYMMFNERYIFYKPLLGHKIYYPMCKYSIVKTGDIFNKEYKFERKGYYYNKVYNQSTLKTDFTSIVNLEQREIHQIKELTFFKSMISYLINRVSICYNYTNKTNYKQVTIHTISIKGRVLESIWLEVYGKYALVLAYKKYSNNIKLLNTDWLKDVNIKSYNIKYIIAFDVTIIPPNVNVKMIKPKNTNILIKLFPKYLKNKCYFEVL